MSDNRPIMICVVTDLWSRAMVTNDRANGESNSPKPAKNTHGQRDWVNFILVARGNQSARLKVAVFRKNDRRSYRTERDARRVSLLPELKRQGVDASLYAGQFVAEAVGKEELG